MGLDPILGILVTLAAVTSYTFIGGFMAVSRTDVLQALLMLGAFMVVSLTLLGVTDNPLQHRNRMVCPDQLLYPAAGALPAEIQHLGSSVGDAGHHARRAGVPARRRSGSGGHIAEPSAAARGRGPVRRGQSAAPAQSGADRQRL